MLIHYNIHHLDLLEEVRRIEKSNNIVRFIVPEIIEQKGTIGIVKTYIIIFDAP